MVVKKVTFRLKEDVSQGIGDTIPGKFEKRYYSVSDAYAIEDCIVEYLKSLYAPEEDVQFDLTIYGKLNETLLAALALDIQWWSVVSGLTYIKPGDNPVRLLPRKKVEFV